MLLVASRCSLQEGQRIIGSYGGKEDEMTLPATLAAYTPTATAVTYTPPPTPVTYGLDASTFRFSVARYQRMIETGILTAEDKVELLENYLVLKMPRNPLHDGTVQLATEALLRVVPQGWRLRVQLTVVLPDSQPEPDFSIVRGDARTYLTRHPGPSDVGLIVEVAESSLLRDQRDKTRIYARAGIPCYWIVNLVDRRIEVYSQPSGPAAVPAYASFQLYQPGDSVPLVLDGNTVGTVSVDELLP
jgi:Uma2 family endonuclease